MNVSAQLVNLAPFLKGLVEAEKLSVRYMRTEMKRGAQRIRKTFIREELQGPPGIKAGKLARGKNIWTFVTGENTRSLSAKIGISRILHVHEKGLTIEPKATGGMLYLHEKGKKSPIIAVVPQVVIPARLKFRQVVSRNANKEMSKVGAAASRGVQTAMLNAIGRS